MEFLSHFYYTYFLFEIYTVLKEATSKMFQAIALFSYLLEPKYFMGVITAVEICLNPPKTQMGTTFNSQIFQERLNCAIA